jgi:hypothetical protein
MSATRELDEAQRRMETGWRIKRTRLMSGEVWCVWRDGDNDTDAMFFADEAHARIAYLVVTQEAMTDTAQTTSHQTPKSDASHSE